MKPLEELQDNQVHIWLAEPGSIKSQEEITRLALLLDSEEQKKYHTIQSASARHSYLIAHALVRLSLSRYARIEPGEWQFRTNQFGQPRIAGNTSLRFSLTRTNGLVACAITKIAAIGIDVESTARIKNLQGVSRHALTPRETEYISSIESPAQHQLFIGIWTLKEAFIKAIGKGLSQPLTDFWFEGNLQQGIKIKLRKPIIDNPANWRFFQFGILRTHSLAIAVQANSNPKTAIRFAFQPATAPSHDISEIFMSIPSG
jgi:4'-phosphopantetheinyl transferase